MVSSCLPPGLLGPETCLIALKCHHYSLGPLFSLQPLPSPLPHQEQVPILGRRAKLA